jgi:hypothetical protein
MVGEMNARGRIAPALAKPLEALAVAPNNSDNARCGYPSKFSSFS